MQNLSLLMQSREGNLETFYDMCEILNSQEIDYKTETFVKNNLPDSQIWVNSEDLPLAKKLFTDYLHRCLRISLKRTKDLMESINETPT